MLDLDVHLPAMAAGDADAFGRWLAGAEPALRAALRRFAAEVDVESVLQEGLLRVWQVAPRVVPAGPNSLLRLAHVVCKNLAFSELRKTRPDALDDADDPVAPAMTPPDPHLRRAIAECRERLPKQPAAALAARVQSAGAEPDETIAAGLGMKPNTFLQNVTRARKLLADCLRKKGVDLALEIA